MLRLLLTLIACLMPFAPATATPPDSLAVTDAPFGLGPDHLFLLRTTSDNLGLHGVIRNDLFLIARDLETGAEDGWPLATYLRKPDHVSDPTGNTWMTEISSHAQAVDPLALMTDMGGFPWSTVALVDIWSEPEVTLDDKTITVVFGNGTGALGLGAAFARMRARVDAFAVMLGEYDRMAPVTNAQLLADRSFTRDACMPGEVHRGQLSWPGDPVILLRVTCETEDVDRTSLLLTLPLKP